MTNILDGSGTCCQPKSISDHRWVENRKSFRAEKTAGPDGAIIRRASLARQRAPGLFPFIRTPRVVNDACKKRSEEGHLREWPDEPAFE